MQGPCKFHGHEGDKKMKLRSAQKQGLGKKLLAS